jgi:hypothetical protein
MGKNLIIAAYERNYDWVKDLNSDVKITVYNKNTETLKNSEILISPNLGRCVHTFFWHIVKNYDNLDDYTITSQDYPFDHNPDYLDVINGNKIFWDQRAQQKLGDCWFFCEERGILEEEVYPHFEQIWNELFDYKIVDKIIFTPTGHFVISKEHLRSRPKSFYQKILNILETDNMSPWVIERLEIYIFDLNIKIHD